MSFSRCHWLLLVEVGQRINSGIRAHFKEAQFKCIKTHLSEWISFYAVSVSLWLSHFKLFLLFAYARCPLLTNDVYCIFGFLATEHFGSNIDVFPA
jgi:hypothetical protein